MRVAWMFVGVSLVATLGMAQSKHADTLSAEAKIAQAKVLLKEAKRALMNRGAYDCCVKDPWCDRCALDHQSCDCAVQIKQGKAVCPDCYAGWKGGDGIVPDVKAEKVRMSSHGHKH